MLNSSMLSEFMLFITTVNSPEDGKFELQLLLSHYFLEPCTYNKRTRWDKMYCFFKFIVFSFIKQMIG